jgi:hypothetical protein
MSKQPKARDTHAAGPDLRSPTEKYLDVRAKLVRERDQAVWAALGRLVLAVENEAGGHSDEVIVAVARARELLELFSEGHLR